MNIRMTNSRSGSFFDVLCDLCGEPISLSETCSYLTPRAPHKGENMVCHAECDRQRTFPGYWSQMHKVRWLLEELLKKDRDRHPTLTAFLATLPDISKAKEP